MKTLDQQDQGTLSVIPSGKNLASNQIANYGQQQAHPFLQQSIEAFQTLNNDILGMAARGELDFNALAAFTLAQRGMDKNLVWRGFDKAISLFNQAWGHLFNH